MHGDVEPALLLEGVERVADLLDRLVRTVEGRAEDRDDADRVLVAPRDRLLGRQDEAIALHRHETHLDVPVVRELLPADLDVDAHHEVRLVGRLALGRTPLLPASLEREPSEHRGLARARRRAARRLLRLRRMPEVGEDVHAAHLDLGRLRVLVLVDHVLVEALGHQLLGLRLHPGRHERRDVQARVAVEHQLVVDDLVRDVRGHLAVGQPVPRKLGGLQAEVGCDREVCRPLRAGFRVLERQRSLRFRESPEYFTDASSADAAPVSRRLSGMVEADDQSPAADRSTRRSAREDRHGQPTAGPSGAAWSPVG